MSDEELQLVPIEELRRLVRLGRMVDGLCSEGVLKPSRPGQDASAETGQEIRAHVKAVRMAVEALAQQVLINQTSGTLYPSNAVDRAYHVARRWYGIPE